LPHGLEWVAWTTPGHDVNGKAALIPVGPKML
jgi:hypothetical protein